MKPQRLVEFGNHGQAAAVQGVPRGAGRQEIGPVRPGLWTSMPIRWCRASGAFCYPGSSNHSLPAAWRQPIAFAGCLTDFAMSWTRWVSLVSISSCLVRTRLSHRWKGRLTSRVLLRPSPGTPALPTSSTTRMSVMASKPSSITSNSWQPSTRARASSSSAHSPVERGRRSCDHVRERCAHHGRLGLQLLRSNGNGRALRLPPRTSPRGLLDPVTVPRWRVRERTSRGSEQSRPAPASRYCAAGLDGMLIGVLIVAEKSRA
jgi:hypothetical protein